MNYYVTIVNKDSPSVVKNLMKLTTRGNTGKNSGDRPAGHTQISRHDHARQIPAWWSILFFD